MFWDALDRFDFKFICWLQLVFKQEDNSYNSNYFCSLYESTFMEKINTDYRDEKLDDSRWSSLTSRFFDESLQSKRSKSNSRYNVTS